MFIIPFLIISSTQSIYFLCFCIVQPSLLLHLTHLISFHLISSHFIFYFILFYLSICLSIHLFYCSNLLQ
ncbi:hypothetical protein J3Q64DRAFT_1146192 [Phycomyces blakesleeanus]|uniref:Uncharacterized protein n=1 Tax=Phycomyces blakesleeanus TaxID=4837 RepID=A0ABR3AW75_PHYBL